MEYLVDVFLGCLRRIACSHQIIPGLRHMCSVCVEEDGNDIAKVCK
jgi:hypothetical protein